MHERSDGGRAEARSRANRDGGLRGRMAVGCGETTRTDDDRAQPAGPSMIQVPEKFVVSGTLDGGG